jgi:hypothetical protein
VVEMSRSARELGISHMLALLPTNWTRWAARCDLDMTAAGRVMNMDGVDYQAVTLNFGQPVH